MIDESVSTSEQDLTRRADIERWLLPTAFISYC